MASRWNPELYQSAHAFVWQYGEELAGVLAPRPGERILDVGCGPGQLTARLAESGAHLLGIDQSPEMIAAARHNFPGLDFECADVTALPYREEFEAVFSNAVLHWVRAADAAARSMAAALKPGGRLVAEFGGKGNVTLILQATYAALRELGISDPERLNPWYYPDAEEYTGTLNRAGLEVLEIALFPRPTRLEGGMSAWAETFCGAFSGALQPAQKPDFLRLLERHAAPTCLRDGVWYADYHRLRVKAVKPQ